MSAADPLRGFLAAYGLSNTSGKRHEARRAALVDAIVQIETERNAFADMETSYLMEQSYHRALEAHLRAHGCSCSFGDVADEPTRIAS